MEHPTPNKEQEDNKKVKEEESPTKQKLNFSNSTTSKNIKL